MEQEQSVKLVSLSEAEGAIHAEDVPAVTELAQSVVRGDHHRPTAGNIICKCIDGRNCEGGLEGPNSAGGSLSLLVADDLTSQRYISTEDPITIGMERLVRELDAQGQPIGVHTDEHAEGEKSGCGANDKLPEIYAMMVKKAEHIRELTEMILGKPVPSDTHDMIMARATERVLFSPGGEVAGTVADIVGDESIETLEGSHKEIVAVINLVEGTTLDRASLQDVTSGEYQAFNIDAWAFEQSARVISHDDDDMIEAKVIAMTYYNIATALVLCGPDMLVGIRR